MLTQTPIPTRTWSTVAPLDEPPGLRLRRRIETLEATIITLQSAAGRDIAYAELRAQRARREADDRQRQVQRWHWLAGLALVVGIVAGAALAGLVL